MVILAAAAITAAGVGAYQGGKAVVDDAKKKIRRSTTQRTRNQERQASIKEQEQVRQYHDVAKQNLSIHDRIHKFKQGIPEQPKTSGGLFRK
jgi:NAD(P)H-dependent flavin oxidoreductase YrpB (nitropropane dioxygenase family)